MKTEEDEAFDELAKKQGSWGGGYQAKRKMAADKQREWVGLTEDEMSMIGYAVNGDEFEAMRLAEAKLKEKNNA